LGSTSQLRELLLGWISFYFATGFLANVNFTFAICCRPSVCRLSVCNTHAPSSGGSNFRQYFYGIIRYHGHPLTCTKNFTEIVPGEHLCRGS